MRVRGNEGGFGLMILIFLLALATLLISSTSMLYLQSGKDNQLLIEREQAYHLATAGVMKALQDWRASSATELSRRWNEVGPTDITGTDLQYKAGVQANFAYFTFNETVSGLRTQWATVSARPQLRRWRIRNIRNGAAITVKGIKVSWTANPANTLGTLRRVSLNGTVVLDAGATGVANGAEVDLDAPLTLASNGIWGGGTANTAANLADNLGTFLEWNGVAAGTVPTIATVHVVWIFDDDADNKDSRTHNVQYWTGSTAGAPTAQRTFSVTSSGGLDRGGNFQIYHTVRATVAQNLEITEIEKVAKGVS